MTKTAPTVQQSDPMAELLASLKPADLSLFERTKVAPKVNPWLPFVRKSLEGKDANGIGAALQFPQAFGESSATSAMLRRAGRDLGVSVQLRWTPRDSNEWETILAACKATDEDSDAGRHNRVIRDEYKGHLAFRVVPQVSRNRTVS